MVARNRHAGSDTCLCGHLLATCVFSVTRVPPLLSVQVINKLTEGSSHVPYRESKLTLLLRESLGGNSRTGWHRELQAGLLRWPRAASAFPVPSLSRIFAWQEVTNCHPGLPWHPSAVIIPTIAPTASSLSETANTLKFAARAKQVKNQAHINEDVSQSAVEVRNLVCWAPAKALQVARTAFELVLLRYAALNYPGHWVT